MELQLCNGISCNNKKEQTVILFIRDLDLTQKGKYQMILFISSSKTSDRHQNSDYLWEEQGMKCQEGQVEVLSGKG